MNNIQLYWNGGGMFGIWKKQNYGLVTNFVSKLEYTNMLMLDRNFRLFSSSDFENHFALLISIGIGVHNRLFVPVQRNSFHTFKYIHFLFLPSSN